MTLPSFLQFQRESDKDPFAPKALYWLERAAQQTWWVFLFVLFCYCVYEHAFRQFMHDYDHLNQSLVTLIEEKEKALAIQENLIRQINSQSDQAWVELTLMKGLGLVPEGYTKVFFTSQE